MKIREQLLDNQQENRRLDDILGNPGTLKGVRDEAEAAIRMKAADWVTIEKTVDPDRAEELYRKKLESIQDELHHYVDSLKMAEEKGIEGVVIPELEFSDEMAEELIEIARHDPRTAERVAAQIEALGLDEKAEGRHEARTAYVDPFESKDDMYGHETLHTMKQKILKLGMGTLQLLVHFDKHDHHRTAA